MTRCAFFIICLLLLAQAGLAQKVSQADLVPDSTTIVRVELMDGSLIHGTVWHVQSDSIGIAGTTTGRVMVARAVIKEVTRMEASSLRGGQYWFPNPHSSRHLFGPSAIPVGRGEGYYQNTYILLNSFVVGLTRHLSIGGGIELLSTFSRDSGGPIFFLTAKGSAKVAERVHLGLTGTMLNLPTELTSADTDESRSSAGLFGGIFTYGTPNHQVTGGVGWGYDAAGLTDHPILTLSTQLRFARKASFVSENWFFPADNAEVPYILSYGVRFMGEKISVDLAFLNNGEIIDAIVIGIPFVSFAVKW